MPEFEVDLSWIEDWLAENGPVVDIDELIIEIPGFCDLYPELCDPDFWVDLGEGPFELPIPPQPPTGPCGEVICTLRIPAMTIPQTRF